MNEKNGIKEKKRKEKKESMDISISIILNVNKIVSQMMVICLSQSFLNLRFDTSRF